MKTYTHFLAESSGWTAHVNYTKGPLGSSQRRTEKYPITSHPDREPTEHETVKSIKSHPGHKALHKDGWHVETYQAKQSVKHLGPNGSGRGGEQSDS